jgi:hypothetical protein
LREEKNMKKIAILFIGLMVISVGFLSGCEEDEITPYKPPPSWYHSKTITLDYLDEDFFLISNQKWEIEWEVWGVEDFEGLNVSIYVNDEFFDNIQSSEKYEEKMYDIANYPQNYTIKLNSKGNTYFDIWEYGSP